MTDEDLRSLSTEELERQLADLESGAPRSAASKPARRAAAPEAPVRLTEANRRNIKPGQLFIAADGKVYRNQPGAGFPGRPAKQPSTAELLQEGVGRIPESAIEFGKNTAAVFNPANWPTMASGLAGIARGTAENIRRAAPEGVRKAVGPLATAQEQALAAETGKALTRPFGYDPDTGQLSVRTAAQEWARDPVGTLSTLAVPFTLGEGALAKAPGMVGKAGRVAGRVGRTLDPLALAVDTTALGAKGAGAATAGLLGVTTGKGSRNIAAAARAGRKGGAEMAAFKGHMTGERPTDDILGYAKSAIDDMYRRRSDEYKAGMGAVHSDPAVLSFAPIDQAVQDIEELAYTRGHTGAGAPIAVNPEAVRVLDRVKSAVDEWRNADPAEFHTAGQLDRLKQRIGVIRDSEQPGSPAYKAANDVYGAVREEIVKQAPAYENVMKAYEEATRTTQDLVRAMGLGDRASTVTAVNRLQRILQPPNRRVSELGKRLTSGASPLLEPALAGEAMSDILPSGARSILKAGVLGFGGLSNPGLFGLLPFMSPRVAGSAAMRAGALSRYPAAALEALGQKYATVPGRLGATAAARAGALAPEEAPTPEAAAPEAAPKAAPEAKPEAAPPDLESMSTEELERELQRLESQHGARTSSGVPEETVSFVSGLAPDEAKALAVVGEASPNLAEMRGVAHVLENRTKRPDRFGSDIYSILTNGEFDAFKTDPEKLQELMASDRFKRALQLVRRVEAGDDKDITGGATHFLAPELMRQKGYTHPAWAKNGKRLGETVFFTGVM